MLERNWVNKQVCCTSRHTSTLLQTMCRIPVLLLTKHEVLYSPSPTNNSPISTKRHVFKGPIQTIVILAIRSDKECSTFERSTGGTNFLYFRNVVWKWCGILVRVGRRCAVLICAVHCRRRTVKTNKPRCENRMWRRDDPWFYSPRTLSSRMVWIWDTFYSRD